MKWFILTLFVFTTLISFPSPSYAQRYAECDACGYCIGRAAPESWDACRNCLYPLITNDATDNKTLEIIIDAGNPDFNQPVPPKKGRYYTQLGCVDTSLSSFSDPGAAGGVLNFILTKLIFPATGVLAFGALIYGSFMLITAQGAEMQIARGKRYVTGSIVGLIFTFSVVLIVNIIGGDVLRIPGFGKGTKITFVGYGTSTTQGGVQTFPNISARLDGKEFSTINSLSGSVSSFESKEVYAPATLDLTNPDELKRITFVFVNDLCLTRQSVAPNSCCYTGSPPPASPNPSCSIPADIGDRNIVNSRILFEDKPCSSRLLLRDDGGGTITTIGSASDNISLGNNWLNVYYQCSSVAP